MTEPTRRRLPDERPSIVHKFTIYDQEGYLIVGMFDDGTPGELFVHIAKEGSTVSGLMDAVAVLTSIALQHGIPLADIAKKMRHTHFEPYGETRNPEIPKASSLVDYIFAWMEKKFEKISGAE